MDEYTLADVTLQVNIVHTNNYHLHKPNVIMEQYRAPYYPAGQPSHDTIEDEPNNVLACGSLVELHMYLF